MVAALIANRGAANERPGGCEPHWENSIGQPGITGNIVYALNVYDNDLIAGGDFIMAGGQTVNSVARWDGTSWHPLASGGQIGMGDQFPFVFALTNHNRDLIAAGNFSTAGGQSVNRIARWDGLAWYPLTSNDNGSFGSVEALTIYNGDLIVGGRIILAGGQQVGNIARWDGAAWHSLSSGGQVGVGGNPGKDAVYALTVFRGELIAGGTFITAGGQQVKCIARWDGAAWHTLASGGQIGMGGGFLPLVSALTIYKGDLVAGGRFTNAGGQVVNNIARWDGSAWHEFASGGQIGVSPAVVRALSVHNGDLVAGGGFTSAGGQTMNHIARWDGLKWHSLGSGSQNGVDDWIYALVEYNGNLIAGGSFTMAGGLPANRVATWHGCPPCGPGDINCDGMVNVNDLLELIGAWGQCPVPPDPCPADVDGDGEVNINDLLMIIANWT